MVLVPLFLVTLLGCPIENTPGGTAVGNPTGLGLTPAPPTDFSFSSASVRLETATFTTCVGDPTVVTAGDTVDLLSGVDLTAPAGTWCAFSLAFGDPVRLIGESTFGYAGDLSLAVGALRFANAGGFIVDDNPLVVELGSPDWFDPAFIGADLADVVITDGPVADALVADIRMRSACYDDANADGLVDDAERTAGPYAVAAGDDDDGDED